MSKMKARVANELRGKRLSQNQIQEMTQYKEHEEFTQTLKLGEHVDCRIRLQETISPEGKELGVDVRKFLNGYPMRGGRQGILIPAEKWLPLLQKEILFTIDAAQEEDWIEMVKWINEQSFKKYPKAYYQEQAPQPAPEKKSIHREVSKEELKHMSVGGKSAEEVNWGELSKMAKKKI